MFNLSAEITERIEIVERRFHVVFRAKQQFVGFF
jgi:hypothetical protein